MNRFTPEQIASVTHAANAAYCRLLGDESQLDWKDASDWQKTSAINGVKAIIEQRVKNPRESHENWMREKLATGWMYGPVKNEEKKTHPCLVGYDQLPVDQRVKDALFFSIVTVFHTFRNF